MNSTRPTSWCTAGLSVGFWAVLWAGFCFTSNAFAQNTSTDSKYELNIQAGTMLPDEITGVTEVSPMWGAFYNIPVAGAGFEFGFLDTHSHGVDYIQVPVRGRLDVPIDNFLTAIAYAGPELNYYTPAGASSSTTIVGFHAGGGALYHILDTLYFRADIKFSVNPGDSLYFGFGFTWRAN